MTPSLTFVAIAGLPMVVEGDDLAALITAAIKADGQTLQDGDIICIAQKVVSKAEGCLLPLAGIEASEEARQLAAETDKDPRLVQLILDESTEVVRKKLGVLIVRHRLGLVSAQAGIDQSNIKHGDDDYALLLPEDPDASATALRDAIQQQTGKSIGVLITDSHNRPWRLGTVGTAIGAAGMRVLDDHRGGTDIYGRELKVTLINRADAIAGAATLLMGETTEKIPLVIARGVPWEGCDDTAAMINRPLEEDLFR
ncbi:MAG: coenzyme F420-0:L-glutamate ligase [Acidiferrobacteraceae bacterium]|jgi:coenzyme F420-0:L-glutamate ligase/coenzyme F420-1:gamma-L-glutamate ligase|nr:coenzyme F420-0:L-glutamate ligase [Acidiferrobacteraceae bacterium]MDP6375467.1 coenzyme F420-0:L-glutamate ligase [Pseudomonadales bacterium]MDP6470629.1 coenzyme F420-0:L-glutamate ligase [Pseudomonadales bacterium]MDP6828516.1 coenzyme F420-0:L-glutamate ligase [Pseudomonadales bacterium]|tara:strand:- start:203 stop:967 length:765 start_codon:yes stop_codon:yes gene_type:complete